MFSLDGFQWTLLVVVSPAISLDSRVLFTCVAAVSVSLIPLTQLKSLVIGAASDCLLAIEAGGPECIPCGLAWVVLLCEAHIAHCLHYWLLLPQSSPCSDASFSRMSAALIGTEQYAFGSILSLKWWRLCGNYSVLF